MANKIFKFISCWDSSISLLNETKLTLSVEKNVQSNFFLVFHCKIFLVSHFQYLDFDFSPFKNAKPLFLKTKKLSWKRIHSAHSHLNSCQPFCSFLLRLNASIKQTEQTPDGWHLNANAKKDPHSLEESICMTKVNSFEMRNCRLCVCVCESEWNRLV